MGEYIRKAASKSDALSKEEFLLSENVLELHHEPEQNLLANLKPLPTPVSTWIGNGSSVSDLCPLEKTLIGDAGDGSRHLLCAKRAAPVLPPKMHYA